MLHINFLIHLFGKIYTQILRLVIFFVFYRDPFSWTPSTLAILGDFLLVVPNDDLNSVPLHSWINVADTLVEQTSYHMKVEWPGTVDQIPLYQVRNTFLIQYVYPSNIPAIATEVFVILFCPFTTCFCSYGPSSGEIHHLYILKVSSVLQRIRCSAIVHNCLMALSNYMNIGAETCCEQTE
jgi:hypothetical protein